MTIHMTVGEPLIDSNMWGFIVITLQYEKKHSKNKRKILMREFRKRKKCKE